jgi:hypothetical protein
MDHATLTETTFIAIEAIVLTVQIGIAALMWLLKREFVTKHELRGVDDKLSEACTKVRLLENDGRHAVGQRDLGSIHEKVNGIDRKVERLSGKIEGMERQLGLILETCVERPA